MLADNLSEVDVACTTVGADTAAEQHVGVPYRVNVAAGWRRFAHDACVVFYLLNVHYARSSKKDDDDSAVCGMWNLKRSLYFFYEHNDHKRNSNEWLQAEYLWKVEEHNSSLVRARMNFSVRLEGKLRRLLGLLRPFYD